MPAVELAPSSIALSVEKIQTRFQAIDQGVNSNQPNSSQDLKRQKLVEEFKSEPKLENCYSLFNALQVNRELSLFK